MNQHALAALEFDRALDVVATHATSEPGAEAVRALRPVPDAAAVAEELNTVDELVSWLLRDEAWAPPAIPDIADSLGRLAIEASVWSESELIGALRLLVAARWVRRSLLPHSSEFRRLAALAEGLLKDEVLHKLLSEALDEETEELKDGASSELKRLRRSVRSARTALVRDLEAVMRGLPDRIAVLDSSVTVRGGRYCIPIRREGRSEVGGIVHDESASQATLFVEPPSAIEPMNLLRELQLSEAREVKRILRQLTDSLRPRAPELEDTLIRLVRLDSLYARAKYALARGCARPQLVTRSEDGYRVVQGRHPLLLEGTSAELVPFDLMLNPGEHTLLVTGPNAGGKTVLLKAVGLISVMTQSGLLPPLGPGSQVPIFRDIFADIGDEQSIDASLSTFTAHLRNINEILAAADSESLCLIDEIGGATDPVEGTALARAVLAELTQRRCMTLATSHLGGLKSLPSEIPGIVSAGLGFDPERLQPLYRLNKGRPGRSYALAMAERIGFPAKVLEAAKAALSQEELDIENLLAELERTETELSERIEALGRHERELADRSQQREQEEIALAQRQRALEREAHVRAREFLLQARKQLDDALKLDRETAREVRREMESSLREHSQALRERDAPSETADVETQRFEPDDPVWVTSLGRSGKVVTVRGSDVVVEVGGVKLQLPSGALRRSDKPQTAAPVIVHTGPEADAHRELDLRGMIAEDARLELMLALDAAVQAGLPYLFVIHGKGTGALRRAVAEQAQGDRRVKSHRLGAPHEGGTGVTVVELE